MRFRGKGSAIVLHQSWWEEELRFKVGLLLLLFSLSLFQIQPSFCLSLLLSIPLRLEQLKEEYSDFPSVLLLTKRRCTWGWKGFWTSVLKTTYPSSSLFPVEWVSEKGRWQAKKSAPFVRLWSLTKSELPPPLSCSSEAAACDVHTLSCPPLSIYLYLSHPTPFLFHTLHLQPRCSSSLSPLTYLHLLPLCFYPSACSTHSFHPLSVRNPPFTFTLSILPPLYNFTSYVSIPLVLCHTFYTPLSSPASVGLHQPYLSCLNLSLISLCLSALLKYSVLNKYHRAPEAACLAVILSLSPHGWISDGHEALERQKISLAIWTNRDINKLKS